MVDLPPQIMNALLVSTGALLFLLIASFVSRPRVFTQYLRTMTGISLKPADVARVYKERGQAGVRDMFLELIIREDLKGGPRITPDSMPDSSLLAPDEAGKKK
jgi:hypothetical protein